MANYMITDQHGNQAVDGMQDESRARKQAQALANRWNAPAYLYESGASEDDFEEFLPATIAAAEQQAASGCADVGGGHAVDDCDAIYD